jgi:hypothetical protein
VTVGEASLIERAISFAEGRLIRNWAETRDGLEAKFTSATSSVVAVSAAVGSDPSPKVRQQRNIRLALALAFRKPVCETAFFQTSSALLCAAAADWFQRAFPNPRHLCIFTALRKGRFC